MTVLSLSGLRCSFGGVQAVRSASFACRESGITGLIGPNGAGKSTVLNAIAGSVSPEKGAVTLDGEDISGLAPYRIARKGIARTFQIPNIFGNMTVMENLLVGARHGFIGSIRCAFWKKSAWRAWEEEHVIRARHLLQQFEMERTEILHGNELSGGQRRLLEIMACLMADPKFMLLDEPMAGISPVLARRLGHYLREISRNGIPMLMVEHELAIVEDICEVVVVMARGEVVIEGSMETIRANKDVADAYLVG